MSSDYSRDLYGNQMFIEYAKCSVGVAVLCGFGKRISEGISEWADFAAVGDLHSACKVAQPANKMPQKATTSR